MIYNYDMILQTSRISILHSMANIELWAVDLSWDIIARFVPHYRLNDQPLPKEFTDDFVKVALDETKHFNLLRQRLEAFGSHFGALPVHNGMFLSPPSLSNTLTSLLAVCECVYIRRQIGIVVNIYQ